MTGGKARLPINMTMIVVSSDVAGSFVTPLLNELIVEIVKTGKLCSHNEVHRTRLILYSLKVLAHFRSILGEFLHVQYTGTDFMPHRRHSETRATWINMINLIINKILLICLLSYPGLMHILWCQFAFACFTASFLACSNIHDNGHIRLLSFCLDRYGS